MSSRVELDFCLAEGRPGEIRRVTRHGFDNAKGSRAVTIFGTGRWNLEIAERSESAEGFKSPPPERWLPSAAGDRCPRSGATPAAAAMEGRSQFIADVAARACNGGRLSACATVILADLRAAIPDADACPSALPHDRKRMAPRNECDKN